jgi:peptidoglycan/xylan/chitin deacetylase (PgdA/CDA1 family)
MDDWRAAFQKAAPGLGLPVQPETVEAMVSDVLGEGQFGPDHWQLSLAKRTYYMLKPFLPRPVIRLLRQFYSRASSSERELGWPIEGRYARFQWEMMQQLLELKGDDTLAFRSFWPEGHRFAFVLTHDIERAEGQAFVRTVADLDESFGFRSIFNFVPERYPLDYELMAELRERGFEIGVHGLKHDGKLFSSHQEFMRRAERINHYLKEFKAVGFRAPLTHRQPEWMQALDIEYDLSFFDTDPYEPVPGGVMSIWPFQLGRFVELPYTLVQDHTLVMVLGETTPDIWLEKIAFIEEHHGMALALTHPDYLKNKTVWKVYADFLEAMSKRSGYWHALPCEVARWWRARAEDSSNAPLSACRIRDGRLCIEAMKN